ncbi:MAG: hypothetical protein MUC31_08755, partial [Bacteroidales bacterium]|nr:hypothetical protein [Bacteroidales bacterium]
MKTYTHKFKKFRIISIASAMMVLIFFQGLNLFSQALTTEFLTAGYTLTDLGSITDLPSQYGGLTIRPSQPNTLYICGYANAGNGNLYTVPLIRDAETHHITGFSGPATLYAAAPDNDGGLFFAPNGTLLFTRYSMNHLGQILPDNTYITTSLTEYGIASSVGSVALVPSGYPGAGNLIFASYNGHIFYNIPYTINGQGLYVLSAKTHEVSVSGLASGPEGIAYIPQGSAGFPNLSMVVSSYGMDKVVVFEVGDEGLPDPATARDMVTGLDGAEGALIDPVTGDFLFSTFGGGDKVIRITGFTVPSAIWDANTAGLAGFSTQPNPTAGPGSLVVSVQDASGVYEIFNITGELILRNKYAE